MQNNRTAAVLLIAALSLLLGLSIGQHYRQYHKIRALERRLYSSVVPQVPRCRLPEAQIMLIERSTELSEKAMLEAQRAELEAIKAKMLREREVQLNELHRQIERVKEMWRDRNH